MIRCSCIKILDTLLSCSAVRSNENVISQGLMTQRSLASLCSFNCASVPWRWGVSCQKQACAARGNCLPDSLRDGTLSNCLRASHCHISNPVLDLFV
ncbi:unnamed protein product [Arabis nemorensis]|uniref:Uncharacterized protein n=1 Tax=Arabis nemorensis TaxID=586526 RepID=A0A565C9U5_9BRAS|nr:unnamed protein product [Arabis nemorensis]